MQARTWGVVVAVALALAPAALAVSAPPPSLSAAAAESIALRAAAGYLAGANVIGLGSSASVESARLGRVGQRRVWIVVVETPAFRPAASVTCRPGTYSYCVPSFLPYGELSVVVAARTGAVLAVAPVRRSATPACEPGQKSTSAKPCSTVVRTTVP